MEELLAGQSDLQGAWVGFLRTLCSEPVDLRILPWNGLVREVAMARADRMRPAIHLLLGEPLPEIRGDRRALEEALGNVLDNALAWDRSGRVEVETGFDPDANEVWVSVQDGGPGIAPEDIRRIFLPGFSRRKGGLGYGLAVVKRVLADHGGRVEVESLPGSGTELRLVVPANVPQAGAAGAERRAPGRKAPMRREHGLELPGDPSELASEELV
jgi:signal transduction histidine kinase